MLSSLLKETKSKEKVIFPKRKVELALNTNSKIEVIAENIADKMMLKLKKNFC